MNRRINFNVISELSVNSSWESNQNYFDANKQQIDDNKYKFSQLQSVTIGTVLDEILDQLAVVGHLNNLPKVEADLKYKTPKERFDSSQPEIMVLDPETMQPFAQALYRQKFVKFQLDRSCFEEILRQTRHELHERNNFSRLIYHLKQLERKRQDEESLLAKEAENRRQFEQVQAQIDTERRQNILKIQKQSEILGNLKDEYEDLYFENKLKSNYIHAWENSRTEQNCIKLNKAEDYYLNVIEGAKTNIEREVRINAEIGAFIRENQKEYETAIEEWMEKYDKEMEIRDTQIQILKAKRDEQLGRLRSMLALYEQHKSEIEEYLEIKEKRKSEEEAQNKLVKAATLLQAWWRGVMVRRGFGKFKKKKGKKGKEGSDKKGKN